MGGQLAGLVVLALVLVVIGSLLWQAYPVFVPVLVVAVVALVVWRKGQKTGFTLWHLGVPVGVGLFLFLAGMGAEKTPIGDALIVGAIGLVVVSAFKLRGKAAHGGDLDQQQPQAATTPVGLRAPCRCRGKSPQGSTRPRGSRSARAGAAIAARPWGRS